MEPDSSTANDCSETMEEKVDRLRKEVEFLEHQIYIETCVVPNYRKMLAELMESDTIDTGPNLNETVETLKDQVRINTAVLILCNDIASGVLSYEETIEGLEREEMQLRQEIEQRDFQDRPTD